MFFHDEPNPIYKWEKLKYLLIEYMPADETHMPNEPRNEMKNCTTQSRAEEQLFRERAHLLRSLPALTEKLTRLLKQVVSCLLDALELIHSILFPVRMFGLLKKKRGYMVIERGRALPAHSRLSFQKIMHKL